MLKSIFVYVPRVGSKVLASDSIGLPNSGLDWSMEVLLYTLGYRSAWQPSARKRLA
jgi:hypothetical protein